MSEVAITAGLPALDRDLALPRDDDGYSFWRDPIIEDRIEGFRSGGWPDPVPEQAGFLDMLAWVIARYEAELTADGRRLGPDPVSLLLIRCKFSKRSDARKFIAA